MPTRIPPRHGLGLMLSCLAVVALATAVRAYELGEDCFDCDELYAVRIQGITPKAVVSVMARDSFHTNHPP